MAGTHRSVNRLKAVGLCDVPGTGTGPLGSTEEFLISAVRNVFPAIRGDVVRGVPTSWAAQPLRAADLLADAQAPVWPDPDGRLRA